MFTWGSVGGMLTWGPAVAYLFVRAAVVCSLVGEMKACEPARLPGGMLTCQVVSGMFSCGCSGMFICKVVSGMFSCGCSGVFTCRVVSGGCGMFTCQVISGMFTCRVVRGMFSCR
jgi:hypothetical protein